MPTYTILGNHPGDGGVVVAEDVTEALIKCFADMDGVTYDEVKEAMKTNGVILQKVDDYYFVYGDYHINQLKEIKVKV